MKIVIASSVATKQSKSLKYDMNQYRVYIITNMGNAVLYIGVTNNLHRRIHEYRNKKRYLWCEYSVGDEHEKADDFC